MPHGGSFEEVAAILGLAVLVGAVGQRFRQPPIIMFLLTGVLAGPACLGLVSSLGEIRLLAQMGIALLLFIVGLKLDLGLIRTTGPVALATGVGQIVFTSAIGFLICLALDMSVMAAAWVAVALTFSSTIIIVKLFTDTREIDSLPGRIAVGFLIVQDVAAIVALVALTTFGGRLSADGGAGLSSAVMLARGAGLLVGLGICMVWVLPRLLGRVARSQELLLLFAVAWAILVAAGTARLGFSMEVGAFLAGVVLATTLYRDAIGSRLSSLRDFLLLFFFIDLGARLEWAAVGSQVGVSLLLSVFVLVGNPLVVLAIMGFMGYRRRTSFKAGLAVAQISEFSLILVSLGRSLGHVSAETEGVVTLVGVITIFASTYMILHSDALYDVLFPYLKVFERADPWREREVEASAHAQGMIDAVVLGLGTYGGGLVTRLVGRAKQVVGVDFDPFALEVWRRRGVPVLYADVADPDLVEILPLDRTAWVASTVRSRDLGLDLLARLRERAYRGKVALTAVDGEEAAAFEAAGAHVVFRPFADASQQAADVLTQAMDVLPSDVDWPIAFREVRLRPGSAFAGATVRSIPLRAETGASILALSRAGIVQYHPGPDHVLFPGDLIVLMGSPGDLPRAVELLGKVEEPEEPSEQQRFVVAEVRVGPSSDLVGRTLAEAGFRQRFSATVVGMRRGTTRIESPGPGESIQALDGLVVIGTTSAIEALRAADSL